jgi:hypothetical protein
MFTTIRLFLLVMFHVSDSLPVVLSRYHNWNETSTLPYSEIVTRSLSPHTPKTQ